MEADRKRKRPAEDWEDKGRTGGDAGKPHGCGGRAEEAARPAAVDNVEDEVEEFFAIVRRMHAAARQFSAGGIRMTEANGRQMLRGERAEGKGFCRWRPAFEWEDFEEGPNHKLPDAVHGGCCKQEDVASATSAPLTAVGRGGKREVKTAENGTAVCLDLNTEPEPERVLSG